MTQRSKYKQISHAKGGWSEWEPWLQTTVWQLACCDCGLVHKHKIAIYVVDKRTKTGLKKVTARKGIVLRTLQVDRRATAGLRRNPRFKKIAAFIVQSR